MIAVGTENQLQPFLHLGCALAQHKAGHLTLVTVTLDGQRPAWLNIPEACQGIPIEIAIKQSKAPSEAILQAARDGQPDLLLIGWRGIPSKGRYLLGSTLDPVIRGAPCDIAVIRTDISSHPKKILVPMSGGPNATLAIELALTAAPASEITALYVARKELGQPEVALGYTRLQNMLMTWQDNTRVHPKVVQAHNVIAGILDEARQGYDSILLGASNEGFLDRMIFGNVPQTIAVQSTVPTIIIKRQSGAVQRYLHGAWWRFFNVFPTLTVSEQAEVYKKVHRSTRPSADFFIMISLASAIATFGLLLNSPAIIIGAMLVAPLMAAIIAIGLGVALGNLRLLRLATKATLKGVSLAILVSFVASFFVVIVMPMGSPPTEVLARTRPSLLDLGVAIFSGMAGAYAVCRKNLADALAGVAISAALVPPLSTIGIGLALSSLNITGGAFLLFLTNLVAVSGASGITFLLVGFHPERGEQQRAKVFQRGIVGVIILTLTISIPLTWLTIRSLQQTKLNRAINQALTAQAQQYNFEIVDWQASKAQDNTLRLDITVRSSHDIHYQETLSLQKKIALKLQRPISLQLSVIPLRQLDTFIPPTYTPTLSPSPTATPTQQPQPTSTPTIISTSTATTIPTVTITPTTSPTATPLPSPTATSTVTSTPAPQIGIVANTKGRGVLLRALPAGKVLTALPEGTPLIILPDHLLLKNIVWVKIRLADSKEGWVAAAYIQPLPEGHQ